MKEQIELLIELQNKDHAIERLRWQMREGPERLRDLARGLQGVEGDIENDKTRIQEVKKSQRQYEAEIEDAIAHIKKSRGRLMGIKNNKEYQALIKAIDETERENAKREDRVLACLEELDQLNKALAAKVEGLSAMRNQFETEQTTTAEEIANVEKELAEIGGSREELVQSIDSQLLGKYERIKIRGAGVAVALVNNATCSECHMNIPPQMYNELQRQDSLKFCPNCQRIIYWKATESAS